MLKHLERKEERRKLERGRLGVILLKEAPWFLRTFRRFPVRLLQLTRIFADFSVPVACVLMFYLMFSLRQPPFVFQINLKLILVSGKTKEFLFSPNDSAADIAKHVYDNWPMGE